MKKISHVLLMISVLIINISVFAASDPCSLLVSNFANSNYIFEGCSGTLRQLGCLTLRVVETQAFFGFVSYYYGTLEPVEQYADGTCSNNKDGTAAVTLVLDHEFGWIKGTFSPITPVGPIFHITSSSLLNQNDQYSNVTGDLVLYGYGIGNKKITQK